MFKPWDLIEVYETDSDLSTEGQNLKAQGYNLDILQTKFQLLAITNTDRSYLLYNRDKHEPMALCFSQADLARRNECRG